MKKFSVLIVASAFLFAGMAAPVMAYDKEKADPNITRQDPQASEQRQGVLGQQGSQTGDQKPGVTGQQDPKARDQRQGVTGQQSTQPGAQRQGAMGQQGRQDALQTAGMHKGSELKDKKVVSQQGEELGSIDDFIISDKGQIEYIILSKGGVMGVGGESIPVPWNAAKLQMGQDQDQLISSLDKQKLDNAPTIEGDNWSQITEPGYEEELRSYYGTEKQQEDIMKTPGTEKQEDIMKTPGTETKPAPGTQPKMDK